MVKKTEIKYSETILDLIDAMTHIEKDKDSDKYMKFLTVIVNLVSENLDKTRLKGAKYNREFRLDGLKIQVTYEKT